MKTRNSLIPILLTLMVVAWNVSSLNARQAPAHKQHASKADQHAGVNQRGDHAMGFSHEKTTHHFRLKADGGVIEVSANDPADDQSKQQIRMHLRHIAQLFAEGDFSAPMFIHDKVPPGVPKMAELKSEISYRFETLDTGGRVVISSKNAEEVEAVHQFLKFQIEDHQTGDSLKVDVEKD